MGVPGQEDRSGQRFFDHLFLDQDGMPTFVEGKRSTGTRIRSEIVSQTPDYAANATVDWPATWLRQTFEEHNEPSALNDRLGISPDEEDAYWEKVDSNLCFRKLCLLFVADEITASLQRIIGFLNNQMVDTEVLGLEVKQYVSYYFLLNPHAECSATKNESSKKCLNFTIVFETFTANL